MAWVTQFMDGFDHYATADIGAKWDNDPSSGTIDSAIFRNSGQSLRINSPIGITSKRLNSPVSNVVFGFGWRLSAIPSNTTLDSSGGGVAFVGNYASGGDGEGQFCIGVLSDGKLRAARVRGFGTSGPNIPTVIGTGTTVFATNTWYYVEVRVFIHATAGAVEIRVNGVVDLLLTGVNTKGATSSTVTAEYFSLHGAASAAYFFDDLYVRSEASATEVTGGFMGDIKVKPFYPNGDGTYSALTPSSGTTHYNLVDEASPNTTDYVSSITALQKDSYNFQDISETGSIKAVQVGAYCYKTDAGFRGVDVFIKSGATEEFGTSKPLSVTPKYALKQWDQDPNTSTDWSQANLNAAEFGVRISADL